MSKYSIREEAGNTLLDHLLFHRDIKTPEETQDFLLPNYEKGVHDPYLMKDMEKSVKRIVKAVKENEKIILFTDYDCDGIPAAVILHDFFKKIGYTNFENYIPHRHEEGFGLNLKAVEEFGIGNAKLLITADCGITDVEEVARLQELGVDVILTDHHLPGEVVPPAFAILNPKQEGCEYPEKMLCGSGVIFKLIQGLLRDEDLEFYLAEKQIDIKDGWEKWLLDMVGMATLSDMVPLRGENRIFAHYGLKVLRKSPRVGLMKLLAKAKTNQKYLVEDDVGFTISPRINAASRMGIPMDAFKLLATTDEVEADQLVTHLDTINNERKGMVAAMIKEIKKKMIEREVRNIIVMGNPAWKPAILGLAANTLMREHNCPVFLWGREDGVDVKGSCRSGTVSVVDIMRGATPETFIDFGGHKMSGGFSVAVDKIHFLENELEQAYIKLQEGILKGEDAPTWIDKKISLDDVNWQTYGVIEKLAPYGEANPKPMFLLEGSEVREVKWFGKAKEHLELGFQNKSGKKVVAISFFAAENPAFSAVTSGSRVNLVACLEKSMFRNFPELRLRIIDINPIY